jgi:hypothetical protein
MRGVVLSLILIGSVGCGGGYRAGGMQAGDQHELPVATDAVPGCSFLIRAQLPLVAWPPDVSLPARTSPLGLAFRVEARRQNEGTMRYRGIDTPDFEDLDFDELVLQLLRRIPTHTPEWTDHNESDPGVTAMDALLDGAAPLSRDLARRLLLQPDDFLLRVEGRMSSGVALFEGPISRDRQNSVGLRDSVMNCF